MFPAERLKARARALERIVFANLEEPPGKQCRSNCPRLTYPFPFSLVACPSSEVSFSRTFRDLLSLCALPCSNTFSHDLYTRARIGCCIRAQPGNVKAKETGEK